MPVSELTGKGVIVTGAAGFIGASLVRALLAAGARVTGITHGDGPWWRLAEIEDELELVALDIEVPGAFDEVVGRARPELAVNLAMTAGHPRTAARRLEQLESSVMGTGRLVEALARARCSRLVQVGSSLEYGPSSRPMSEGDVLAPTVPRGAAKAASSLVALAWARALGLSAVVLRPFSVYGPWEDESRLVPTVLQAVLRDTELRLTERGVAHDFVYVGDVVDAILSCLEGHRTVDGEIVNIGSGIQTTNEELVAIAARVVGRDARVKTGTYAARAHDTRTWVADVRRASELLGWTPSTGLDEGLRRTLSWLTAREPARAP